MALTRILFDQLVDDHSATLYRVAYRMLGDPHEAEDLVQETYRSAWNSRSRFDTERISVQSGGRAWLVVILRRRIADFWRRNRNISLANDETIDREVYDSDPTSQGYCDEVQRALDELPDVLRETLLLVSVAELTHQEAADTLGIPLGTVLSRVSRARTRMRKSLANVDRLTQ